MILPATHCTFTLWCQTASRLLLGKAFERVLQYRNVTNRAAVPFPAAKKISRKRDNRATLLWTILPLLTIWAFSIVLGLSAVQAHQIQSVTRSAKKICSKPIEYHAPDGEWSDQERWAWNERICLGKTADLSERHDDGTSSRDCDVSNATWWPDDRVLTQNFVATIMFHKPFRDTYGPGYGLRIRCAKFEETLELSHSRFMREVQLENSLFSGGIEAVHFHVGSGFSLRGSRFNRPFNADRLIVEGDLSLDGKAVFQDVDLTGARITNNVKARDSHFEGEFRLRDGKIEGSINARGSRFDRKFSAQRLEVGKSLFMRRGAVFGEDVDLVGAVIGSNLDMTDSRFDGKISAQRLTVNGNLFMRDGAVFGEDVDLMSAVINGVLEMTDSRFDGKISAQRLTVGRSLQLRDKAVLKEEVDLAGARVGGNVDMKRAKFYGKVDLTAGNVKGILDLGDKIDSCPEWSRGSQLLLSSTRVSYLQARDCSWKNLDDRIELTGFDYQELLPSQNKSNASQTGVVSITEQNIEWLLEWLGMQMNRYSPQPYERLAETLKRSGHDGKAHEVMIAAIDLRLANPDTALSTKMWLWVHWATIDYGYNYWRALYPLYALLTIGMLVGWLSSKSGFKSTPRTVAALWEGLGYSLDRLIPGVQLNDSHTQIRPRGWVCFYFYIHALSGLVLAAIVAAGLSGLIR